jgi:predicted DNA-binding protein
MSAKSHHSRMTIDLPEEDHKRLKALAAVLGITMREIIVNLIHDHLYSTNSPNKETLEAIASVEKGKDLVESKDIDDMFRKLEM